MLTRRLVASACALSLAVPAAAGAKDVRYVGHAHHAVLVATGDTKSDLPGAAPAVLLATGDTKSDLPGAAPAVPPGDTKDDLPSTPASHNTAIAPRAALPSTASVHDTTNGWRLAAVIEGGLLVAFATGAAVLMAGRRQRAPRVGV